MAVFVGRVFNWFPRRSLTTRRSWYSPCSAVPPLGAHYDPTGDDRKAGGNRGVARVARGAGAKRPNKASCIDCDPVAVRFQMSWRVSTSGPAKRNADQRQRNNSQVREVRAASVLVVTVRTTDLLLTASRLDASYCGALQYCSRSDGVGRHLAEQYCPT